jgi:hypothetical protein
VRRATRQIAGEAQISAESNSRPELSAARKEHIMSDKGHLWLMPILFLSLAFGVQAQTQLPDLPKQGEGSWSHHVPTTSQYVKGPSQGGTWCHNSATSWPGPCGDGKKKTVKTTTPDTGTKTINKTTTGTGISKSESSKKPGDPPALQAGAKPKTPGSGLMMKESGELGGNKAFGEKPTTGGEQLGRGVITLTPSPGGATSLPAVQNPDLGRAGPQTR